MKLASKWIELETILNEVTQKDKHHMLSLVYRSRLQILVYLTWILVKSRKLKWGIAGGMPKGREECRV